MTRANYGLGHATRPRLAAQRVIRIFYRDSLLRTVGIMGLFPGSRERVTAPVDPVLGVKFPWATHPLFCCRSTNSPPTGYLSRSVLR